MKKILILSLLILAIVAPKKTGAIQLLGGGGNYLSFMPAETETTSTGLTYMIWYYSTSTKNAKLLTSTSTGAVGTDTFVRYQSPEIRCAIVTSSQTTITSSVGGGGPNRWNHYACTYDGSNMRGYINGVLVITTAKTGTVPLPSRYRIGQDMTRTDDVFSSPGWLFDARVYSRALTLSEIKTYYYTGAAPRTGLVHHFPLWNNGMNIGGSKMHATTTGSLGGVVKIPFVGRYRR